MTNTDGIDAASNGRSSDLWFESWLHFSVERPTTGYCRVTFDHPPINTITATTVAELAELVGLIEQDADLNVVVFASANPDFYLAHYDSEHDPSRRAALPPGPTDERVVGSTGAPLTGTGGQHRFGPRQGARCGERVRARSCGRVRCGVPDTSYGTPNPNAQPMSDRLPSRAPDRTADVFCIYENKALRDSLDARTTTRA
ncbi:hypothetical protein [Mycobacterium sp.]|uniref:hypothetical protein n=1 Tax=Mycobacterium sp. TaxID=1785 RepID=UPI003F97B63B